MAMYNTMLKERGLQSAIWGHVGNNHLHVNILPNDSEEYRKGKELYKMCIRDRARAAATTCWVLAMWALFWV